MNNEKLSKEAHNPPLRKGVVGSSTSKKITVNEKLFKKIQSILSEESSIGNIPEFQEYEQNYNLFERRPENWTELENAIYEHTERVNNQVMKKIRQLLLEGNAR